MIAPLGPTDTEAVETRRCLRRARRLVASTFFKPRWHSTQNLPAVSALRAWIFAAWVVIVTGVYFATMLGLL